jgi:hypothetical protein
MTMKSKRIRQNVAKKRVSTTLSVTAFVLAASISATATAKPPPPVFLPGYPAADQQTNFLTFLGKFIPENPDRGPATMPSIP